MQVLVDSEIEAVGQLINQNVHADYVYMYPPRQAYRSFGAEAISSLPNLVASSLAKFEDLNLYVHVPFCRQICSFCNLYSTNDKRDTLHYVRSVLAEARSYAALTDKKRISTLYLGGGTPSILPVAQVELIVAGLLQLFSSEPTMMPAETAIEVDPATVDVLRLRDLKHVGINRINLGYQSMVNVEVARLGRKRAESSGLGLLEQALSVGFSNVCVDLIYGLEQQTDESWIRSLEQVIEVGPPTVCAYALTSRPYTGYHRRGFTGIDGTTLYRRYDLAREMLASAGYGQETHVRWVKGDGGYIQKANHWAMQNILGFGAGSRSYLWDVDFRNGYSVRARSKALDAYVDAIEEGKAPVTDGYVMSPEERLHKGLTLGIQRIDRSRFRDLLGVDPMAVFGAQIASLASLDLLRVEGSQITLTDRGLRHRDLIAQVFFSGEVRARVREFDYDE